MLWPRPRRGWLPVAWRRSSATPHFADQFVRADAAKRAFKASVRFLERAALLLLGGHHEGLAADFECENHARREAKPRAELFRYRQPSAFAKSSRCHQKLPMRSKKYVELYHGMDFKSSAPQCNTK